MRKRLAFAFALVCAAGSAAADGDGISFTTNIDHDQAMITCADIEMRFWKNRKGDLMNVRRDQEVRVALPTASALRVRAAAHGGIRVQAATGSTASAVVCMAAGAKTEAAANEMLDRVRIVNSGGELRVTGPDDDWGAYILLSVPKGASLDLGAENGDLAVHGVDGKFVLRTTNGPISIVDAAGEIDGEAVNGPIDFRGHNGDVRLAAQNGPIGVKLDASSWSGKGLDASTQNGPVDFTAPDGLKSGVEVEGSEHSPFSWKGLGRTHTEGWDRDHTVRFGEGPVVVRLSTVNGPVSIQGGSQAKTTARSSKGVKI